MYSEFERKILNDKNMLLSMNYYLTTYQFSEEFLVETRNYYNGIICLKSQKNLSYNFVMNNIYNNKIDRNYVTMDDVENYFKD